MLKSILNICCSILLTIPVMANAQAQSNVVQTAIEEIGKQYAPDAQTAIYTLSGEWTNDTLCLLKGECDNREAVDALLHRLDAAGISYMNQIKLLPDQQLGYKTRGVVTVCCAHLRGAPRHASEMVSQAILGTPLLILEKQKDWYRVQTPDNYISWIIANSIIVQTEEEWARWKDATRYIYTGYQGFVYESPTNNAAIVSDIVAGAILQADGNPQKSFVPVSLPDGRKGFLKRDECCELAQWASLPLQLDKTVATAKQMMGTTYLWGGTSVKGADCSGFVKTAYFCGGVILMRDASQQALTGEMIPPDRWKECQTGDLLFFANANGRVNHVALYLNDGKYIHSSGRVKINSIDPESDDYRPDNFVSISRIKTQIGTLGITAVKKHPWYFNQE